MARVPMLAASGRRKGCWRRRKGGQEEASGLATRTGPGEHLAHDGFELVDMTRENTRRNVPSVDGDPARPQPVVQ